MNRPARRRLARTIRDAAEGAPDGRGFYLSDHPVDDLVEMPDGGFARPVLRFLICEATRKVLAYKVIDPRDPAHVPVAGFHFKARNLSPAEALALGEALAKGILAGDPS